MLVAHDQNPITFAKQIIKQVSRTFAISIRLLTGSLGKAVLTGYLLCRIADTIEDDSTTSSTIRSQLLTLFSKCPTGKEQLTQFITAVSCIKGDEPYLKLLHNSNKIFNLLNTLPNESAKIVWSRTEEMVLGMRDFVEQYPQGIHIQSTDELHRYCYYVAGTVGHMLTDLFYYHSPFISKATYHRLLVNCEAFGEVLQIVNILKDVAWDVEFRNHVFIPADVLMSNGSTQKNILADEFRTENYESIKTLVNMAKLDLTQALQYFYTIPRMAITIRLFCLVPLVLAIATLREIQNTQVMLQKGGMVKISRKEVRSILFYCGFAIMSNKLISRLVERVSKKPFLIF